MKRILYFLLSAFLVIVLSLKMANAQNNVGVNTKTPSSNAALDIKAVGKQGILIPRLTAADTLVAPFNSASLSNKDKGLMFYDTVGTQFLYWNGLKWKSLGGILSTGPKGDKGDPGPQGPIGLTGADGAVGSTGPQGPIGLTGPTGATGPQGPIGLTGSAGPIGPQGPIGLTGADGAVGATGPQGPIGLTGPTGATGPQGPIGLTGPAGPIGPQGPIGLTGADGAVGATGPQGPIGLTGPTGATGPQGPIGLTGSVGPIGPQGPIGLTGADGAVGATGPQGPIGLTGPTGATGPQGPIGLTGSAGPIGPQGPIGLTGADGATGPQGPIGLTGPTGATGPQGPIGLTGSAGPIGPQGPIGLTGADGAVGATGPQGPIGLTGPTGATGPQGPIGLTGLAGTNGADGKTVLNGSTDPTAAIGVIGDFYINTSSNKIFGPRGASAWPATGSSLVGPAGGFSITGTTGQTIFHDGTDWKATGNLYNDGNKIGIGAVPDYKLHVVDKSSDPAIYVRQNDTGPSGVFEGGNVGIGILKPNHLLTVNGNSAESNIQLVNDQSGTSNSNGLILNFDGKNGSIINKEKGDMILGTFDKKDLILNLSGVVQIPNLVGPGVVQADNLGNLSIGTAMYGSGTKNYLSKWPTTGSGLGDSRIFDSSSYVGIGRTKKITAASYFDIELPTSGASYGGMYLNSQSATGMPFYGYALDGTASAWTYLDGTTSEWRLYNNGDRLIVKNTGVVRIPNLAGSGSVIADASGNLSVNNSAFSATNSSVSTIPNNTWTTITFNSEEYDIDGNFSSSIFKAPSNGIYHIDASVGFSASATANIQYSIAIFVNNVVERRQNLRSHTTPFSISINADLKLTAGDTVDIRMFQTEVPNRNTLFGSTNCYFNGHRIF